MHLKKSEVQMGKESCKLIDDFSSSSSLIEIRIDKVDEVYDLLSASHCNSISKVPSVIVYLFSFLCCRLRLIFFLSFLSIILLFTTLSSSSLLSSSSSVIIIILSATLFSILTVSSNFFRFSSLRLFRDRFFFHNFMQFFNAFNIENLNFYCSTFTGLFVQNYSNGDIFEGELKKGMFYGSGVYYYSMGGRFEGEWVDGKYDGYGVRTWPKGSLYKGKYMHGLSHGLGVHQFFNGEIYAGEWLNGKIHGYGLQTYNDGSRYSGEFKSGVKQGLGIYYSSNGDIYAGEYLANKMHGYGVYNFANGHRYEGSWYEGAWEGLGIYTSISGETRVGQWHNGILGLLTTFNTLLVTPAEVLDDVQNARRASQRAFDLPMIDEKVRKAIAAAETADIAANTARLTAFDAVQNSIRISAKKSWCKKILRKSLDYLMIFRRNWW